MSDPMEGITDRTVTLEVSAGQYAVFSEQIPLPGRPRVTHKLSVGPFSLPGTYIVTGVHQRVEPPTTTHWATFARMAE